MPSLIPTGADVFFMRTKGHVQLGVYGTCGCVIHTNLHIVLSSHIVVSFPGLSLALSTLYPQKILGQRVDSARGRPGNEATHIDVCDVSTLSLGRTFSRSHTFLTCWLGRRSYQLLMPKVGTGKSRWRTRQRLRLHL